MAHGTTRPLIAAAAALAAAALLAGCTGTPAPAKTSKAATPTATASAAPTLDPKGDAQANLAYFDSVNQALIAKGGDLGGRSFIDDLVAKGFVKADMELTPDVTSAGLKADNIQFSVHINTTCLIGQYGNIGYASEAVDELGTGKCLVGKTRAIDW